MIVGEQVAFLIATCSYFPFRKQCHVVLQTLTQYWRRMYLEMVEEESLYLQIVHLLPQKN